MKALCWYGAKDVRIDQVPDPAIQEPTDAIVRVTATAICGSDLHLYNGYQPEMSRGDVLGHEFMGEVVEVGSAVRRVAVGQRVVASGVIACGDCEFCKRELWSLCDRSNPRPETQRKHHGTVTSAVFGFSGVFGAVPGGQAEFVRVPYADVGLLEAPSGLPEEKLLFLSDIFPTGFMAAENSEITPGATVAVWGCGPVGQMVMLSARLLGAGRILAIDAVPERLGLAGERHTAEMINFLESDDVVEELRSRTGGMGPDFCIDAVGLEAHGSKVEKAIRPAAEAAGLQMDHPICVQQALMACRKGGTVSIAGVYGGSSDSIPLGIAFVKSLTIRMGNVHVHRYMRPLLERIARDNVDPSFIITHRLPLEEAPRAYELFDKKQDGCIKVVLRP